MSTSDTNAGASEFDGWIADEFAERGAFTALVILLDIGEREVTPLCSTYFNVIGAGVDWEEITVLFAGAGVDWTGASFFPVNAPDGSLLDNPAARLNLRELERRLDEDRLVLNEGHFFDKLGRRMMIEEDPLQ